MGARGALRGPLWLVAALAFLPGLPLPQRPRAGGGNGALGCCSCVPSLCLTSCLLPLPEGSGESGKHSTVGLVAGEGAPDKAEFAHWGKGENPSLAVFAQKAARERVCSKKQKGVTIG